MFFENDRTYCANSMCVDKRCPRNQLNIVGKPRFVSMANFEGTKECLKTKSCTKCKHILFCEGAMCGSPCRKYEE